MSKQKVPDIDFRWFVLGEIPDLFWQDKIYINPAYQRGEIWTYSQKVELIKSIENRYSIGVLVLFVNDKGQYEILDGQQRLLAIKKYLSGGIDLSDTELTPYKDLSKQDKILIDAYCIYYLKLKSHDAESKEEDIVQTFIRLQEGTPLNRAEKINAHRGAFKDTFRESREKHELFSLLHGDKRFRMRLLAAEMLLLELEADFQNKIFPSIELRSFIAAIEKYKRAISATKLRYYHGNLDILYRSLNYLLTAMKPRDVLAFYLLVSYLRKQRAGNDNIIDEVAAFAKEFLHNMNSFGIYDKKAPPGMTPKIFSKYRDYKLAAKVMTSPDSIKDRLNMILSEFKRLKPFIEKDPQRYHDEEQKRVLYFKQKGLCSLCGMPLDFRNSSSDHMIAHSEGGKTQDLTKAQLLHPRCHKKLEKTRKKSKNTN